MNSLNFVVLGDASAAGELGKKGAVADITFYEKKLNDTIFSFIVPSGFPEKIQPLIQSVGLAEFAILNVGSIDKPLGEQIVALDRMGMERGFVIANGFEDDVKKIIKSTVVENYEFLTLEQLKQRIVDIEPVSAEGPTKILIDAAFEVKGVGTVALGVLRRGGLKKHDELEIFPVKKPVSVRSIQMHDDDVENAVSPARVGVAIKGANAADIARGDVIAVKDSTNVGSEIKINFEKNIFYRQELNSASSYHLCIGLQIKPVKIEIKGSEMTAISSKPFAYDAGERCLLVDLNSESMRIVGRGRVERT